MKKSEKEIDIPLVVTINIIVMSIMLACCAMLSI